MGFGGISPGSLLLIFLICVLLFGTKRLRGLGEDLGKAFKGFKSGLNDEPQKLNQTLHVNAHDNNQSVGHTEPSNTPKTNV